MLNSVVTGAGLPVVFIHGFGEDLSLWHGIRVALSQKYKIIAVDLPGFGKSKPLEAPFTLFDIADIVHAHVTKNLKINQFVVLGHSLGGYISLALTKTYPQSVLAFGLINSTSFADSDDKKENRLKTIDFINKHGAAFFLQSFVPNLFTPENQTKHAKDVLRVLEMGNNLSDSILTSYMLAMRNRPNLSALLSTRQNILLVAGLLDPHFSYKDIMLEVALLKQFKNGHLFENVAHMSMIEAEKQLEIVISDFLDNIINV
jgi:pimeloyl-ACP methyl ester carboxylesterase